jgi:hypothetical protein
VIKVKKQARYIAKSDLRTKINWLLAVGNEELQDGTAVGRTKKVKSQL